MPLPPWLNIMPSQFTEAAIAGGQLGQRTAQEAAELAQRGIAQASEIANRAEALQVQRESIAAELAGRQAMARQRADEAAGELALAQQQFGLERQAQQEAAARIGQQDAVMQEAQSRYQRAINSGDDPAAADLEILQPLRDVTGGGRRAAASAEPRNQLFNLGDGEVISVNPVDGTKQTINPMREQNTGTRSSPLDRATSSKLKSLEANIADHQRRLNNPETPRSRREGLIKELEKLNAERDALFAKKVTTAMGQNQTFMVPPSEIPTGAPKSGMTIFDPPMQQLRPGFGIPELAASPAAAAQGVKILSIRKR